MLLRHGDNNKCGTLKQSLNSQYALGNNQQTDDLTMMTNFMTNHKWDKIYMQVDKKTWNINKKNDKMNEETDQTGQSMMQKNGQKDPKNNQCFKCREFGHISPNCPHPDIPKDEWQINRTKSISAAQKPVIDKHIDKSFRKKAESKEQKKEKDT